MDKRGTEERCMNLVELREEMSWFVALKKGVVAVTNDDDPVGLILQVKEFQRQKQKRALRTETNSSVKSSSAYGIGTCKSELRTEYRRTGWVACRFHSNARRRLVQHHERYLVNWGFCREDD